MDGFELALLAIGAYGCLITLVRLLTGRRNYLLKKFRYDWQQERNRRILEERQAAKEAAANKSKSDSNQAA